MGGTNQVGLFFTQYFPLGELNWPELTGLNLQWVKQLPVSTFSLA